MGFDRRRGRGARTAIALGCVALTALGATPDSQAQPSVADRETARSWLKQGDEHVARGDLTAALAAYRSAHAAVNAPTTGLAVARVELALGLLLEARESALSVIRLPEAPGEPPQFAKARTDAAALAVELATRIPLLRVLVEGPPGVEPKVLIDGVPMVVVGGAAVRKINPGKHRIIARAAGHRERIEELTVAEAEERMVSFDLVAEAPTTLPSRSRATPPSERPPDAVEPGELRLSPLVFAGFAVALVGTAVGAVSGGLSLSETSNLERRCPDKTCPEGALDSAQALATTSNIAFAAAGLGAALGLVGILVSERSPRVAPAGRAWIAPRLGPLSLRVDGAF